MVFQATLTLSVRPTLGDSRVKVNFILPHKASETWDGNEEKGLCKGQPIIFHQYRPRKAGWPTSSAIAGNSGSASIPHFMEPAWRGRA
jgi:hypothetical protein